MKRFTRRQFVLSACLSIAGAGCGTILHPERRGQPAGPLDWKIVALNSLGLLLFFIPGVIAFAVDFTTGAIYLPPPGYGYSGISDGREEELTRLDLPREELDEAGIARAVSKHVGQPIRLDEGNYETAPLGTLDEFWTASRDLAAAHTERDPTIQRAQSAHSDGNSER